MHDRRNVELKARDRDPARTLRAALEHGATDAGVLHQRDVYFAAPEGRLKLRIQDDGAQLIAYARADAATARLSSYRLVDVPDPDALIAALDASLGITIEVVKRRRLLLWQDVRIHLDDVDGLGHWVELEAVAAPDSDLEAEHAKVAELRTVLGMRDEQVVAEGYAAMLLAAGAATQRLVDRARTVMERAYVPYSHFHVGAALRDEQGRIHAAANVENGAYPQSQCAEASAIGVLVAAGGQRIDEIAVMADTELITPCGGCRQRLSEFAEATTPVHLCGPEGIRRSMTLGDLLPHAFNLGAARASAERSPGGSRSGRELAQGLVPGDGDR